MLTDVANAREVVKNYGSDFFQGIMQMPIDKQKAIVELYKFVRVPDQIVDSQRATNADELLNMKRQLELYFQSRKKAYDDNAYNDEQFWSVVQLFNTYNIDFWYSESFFTSMLMDTEVFRYDTYQDLKQYIYGSAEVIGLMMIQIIWYSFGPSTPLGMTTSTPLGMMERVKHCAAKLGEAFQLSNFLRDVHEDWNLGRVYLPQEILKKYNISDSDLKLFSETRTISAQFESCMKELVDLCDAMHDEANEWIELLNPSCQKAIRLSSDLHRQILGKIRKYKYNVFDKAFDKNSYGRMIA